MTNPEAPVDVVLDDATVVLRGAKALGAVDVDVAVTAWPAEPERGLVTAELTQSWAGFDTERYLLADGVPADPPPWAVLLASRVSLDGDEASDQPPAVETLDLGADVRWLPSEQSFTEGESWRPTTGSAELSWATSPEVSPRLDPEYVYPVGDGALAVRPALVFGGGAWMHLGSAGLGTQALAFALVAVLRPGTGAVYGVLESAQPQAATEADESAGQPDRTAAELADYGLRHAMGTLQLWTGPQVLGHRVDAPVGRPVVVVLSLDAEEGRLLVVDRNRSSRSFSTAGVRLLDTELYLARTGGAYDADATAVMNLLELDFFDHALDFAGMAAVAAELDAGYGVGR